MTSTLTLYAAALIDRQGRGYYQKLSDGSYIPTSLKQGEAIAAAQGLRLIIASPPRAAYGGGKGRQGSVTVKQVERAIEVLKTLKEKNSGKV